MKYVHLLLLICSALLGACKPVQVPAAQEPHIFRININATQVGGAVNRLVLGNNVQWVDRGDELLTPDGKELEPTRLALAQALAPSMLRYPGGSLADTYHWRSGIGERANRGQSEHFYSRQTQTVLMGTREFLELCEATGALPLITVNVATGTPEEAAEWVRQTNLTGFISARTGKRLPRVEYWEIGNEPYLKDENQKSLWMTPENYAQRANAYIRAMRSVDARIKLGIPLRSDIIGGLPATPYQGFNRTVLAQIVEPFDFVSLHNAYLPLGIDKTYKDIDLFTAATGAVATVADDFEVTRQLLRQLKPGAHIDLAVTEYNALFSLGKGHSDDFIVSQVGALYVADLLRLFVLTPDLLAAHYWSLSGNWKFGAISNSGRLRPGYAVLKTYAELLHGNLVSVQTDTDVYSIPQVGYAKAVPRQEKIAALATLDGNQLRVLLFNRDLQRSGQGSITVLNREVVSDATLKIQFSANPFDSDDHSDQLSINENSLPVANSFILTLPPAGIALLTLRLGKGSP